MFGLAPVRNGPMEFPVHRASRRITDCSGPLALGVEHVGEAPEQALALVGELEPVRPDALDEDAEGLQHRGGGVVVVRDVAGVELAALGGHAVERRVVAVMDWSCASMASMFWMTVITISSISGCTDRSAGPDVMSCWEPRTQRNHLGLEALVVGKIAFTPRLLGVLGL